VALGALFRGPKSCRFKSSADTGYADDSSLESVGGRPFLRKRFERQGLWNLAKINEMLAKVELY